VNNEIIRDDDVVIINNLEYEGKIVVDKKAEDKSRFKLIALDLMTITYTLRWIN